MKKVFLCILLIFTALNAKDSLYYLPKESNIAVKEVETLLKESKKSIDIAMYNFTYKKFAKLLKDSVRRGVRVTVILDKKKALEEKKTQYDYLVKNGIDVILLENKLHIKMAIIDKRNVIFGSANWKKKSFKNDYEILYISDDKKMLSRFNHIFKELLQEYK